MNAPHDWREAAPELLVLLSDTVVQLLGELMPGGFTKEEESVIGFEAACRMTYAVGGTTVYFPSVERLEELAKHQKILESFDGTNVNQVAIDVGLSGRMVYKVLKQQHQKKRAQK